MNWINFREEYLAYSRAAKSENTHYRDRRAIESLEKFLRPETVESITTRGVEFWRDSRGDKSPATLNRDLKAIKAMLHKAKSWGYIKDEFWHDIRLLRESRGRLLYYTVADFARILEECRCRYPKLVRGHDRPYNWETVAMLAGRAGLRRSEIRYLAWSDIDLTRGVLAVTPKDGWNPKDFEPRYVPISDDLGAHLRGLPRDSEWVLWPRPSLDVMTSYFRKIVKRAGLAGGIHTLRHTFASHLVQNGVPIYDVSKLLGHSDVKMTEVYAHLSPNNLAAAISRLPALPSGQQISYARHL